MMENTSVDNSASAAGQKRTTTAAGFSTNPNRPVKRRASKACQCCRARKVRCNVVEHGAPCTNCRLDDVECVITESKRRKKTWTNKLEGVSEEKSKTKPRDAPVANTTASPVVLSGESDRDSTYGPNNNNVSGPNVDAAAPLQNTFPALSDMSPPRMYPPSAERSSTAGALPVRLHSGEALTTDIPAHIKSTPKSLLAEDIEYLAKKGALSLPLEPLRSELIECYFLYVHPFMPLIDEREFRRVASSDWDSLLAAGEKDERLSLLLVQAMYFAGSAFVPMESLRQAGYPTRKAARKSFFSRTRLLYDFDWEHDRISLIQALLLLTYWYETPDDQKDTWHWMGLAISLAQTIGLHRNPESSSMDVSRQHHWKRIWWSCFMRDRLVALGMRRPTRIKFEDCDVPMLNLTDFDLDDCTEAEFKMRIAHLDAEEQRRQTRNRRLAIMCIEKAKLSVIISNVLSAQYSVANSCANDGEVDTTRNTMLLHPKKFDVEVCEVKLCDEQLSEWQRQLSPEAMWRPANDLHEEFDQQITLHRNLLHMVYFTTLSALHRPQVLPSAPAPWPARNRGAELQEISRKKVRQAAQEITRLAEEMIEFDLVKFLPTVGVTVMLPAVIIHLLDIKSSSPVTRKLSIQGFTMCMQVLQELRESYASADFATHFLEAAVKKADIQLPLFRHQYSSANSATKEANRRRQQQRQQLQVLHQRKKLLEQQQQQQQMLVEALAISTATADSPLLNALTPPPEEPISLQTAMNLDDDSSLRLRLESFLSASPPSSLSSSNSPVDMNVDLSKDFDTFIDSNATSPQEGDATTPSVAASLPLKARQAMEPTFEDVFGMNAVAGLEFDPFLGAPTTFMQGAGESGGLDLSFMSKGPAHAAEFDFDKIMESLEGDMA